MTASREILVVYVMKQIQINTPLAKRVNVDVDAAQAKGGWRVVAVTPRCAERETTERILTRCPLFSFALSK